MTTSQPADPPGRLNDTMALPLSRLVLLAALGTSTFCPVVQAQAPRAPGGAASAPMVTVALTVSGKPYRFSGPGRCTHAPAASIYRTAAEMWSAQHAAGDRSLALSVWKPKDGSNAMATLSLASGTASHDVSTVRGGGPTSASGAVTFRKMGAGGTFTLNLQTNTGATVVGTIDCSAFAQHVAEGG